MSNVGDAHSVAAAREQLRLLSVFHYVLAGVTALFSLFPLIHVGIGVAIVSGKFPLGARGGPPDAFGWIFIVMGAVFILMGFAFAVLVAVAGRFLRQGRHWTYCVVMAALCCAFFPFGTALGVFTFIALAKAEVKALFEAMPTTPIPPPPAAGPPAASA
jgi:hypothetical protein